MNRRQAKRRARHARSTASGAAHAAPPPPAVASPSLVDLVFRRREQAPRPAVRPLLPLWRELGRALVYARYRPEGELAGMRDDDGSQFLRALVYADADMPIKVRVTRKGAS